MPLNVSRVCPQDGQTKLSASRGAEWNSVRSYSAPHWQVTCEVVIRD
jgi:hypothetical protein